MVGIVYFREESLHTPGGRVTNIVLINHRPPLSLQPFTYEKDGYDWRLLDKFLFAFKLSLLLSLEAYSCPLTTYFLAGYYVFVLHLRHNTVAFTSLNKSVLWEVT